MIFSEILVIWNFRFIYADQATEVNVKAYQSPLMAHKIQSGQRLDLNEESGHIAGDLPIVVAGAAVVSAGAAVIAAGAALYTAVGGGGGGGDDCSECHW